MRHRLRSLISKIGNAPRRDELEEAIFVNRSELVLLDGLDFGLAGIGAEHDVRGLAGRSASDATVRVLAYRDQTERAAHAPAVALGELLRFVATEGFELASEDKGETGQAVVLSFGDLL